MFILYPECFYIWGFFLPIFKNYFSPVIQCGIDFHKNLIKKIKKYFIFIW